MEAVYSKIKDMLKAGFELLYRVVAGTTFLSGRKQIRH